MNVKKQQKEFVITLVLIHSVLIDVNVVLDTENFTTANAGVSYDIFYRDSLF